MKKNQNDVTAPSGAATSKNGKTKIAMIFVAIIVAIVVCIIMANGNKEIKYEYKELDYEVNPTSEDVVVDTEKAAEYLVDIGKDDALVPDEVQYVLHENKTITDDNIYSSYDAIDWSTIPFGSFVYYYDDMHIANRIVYTPKLTEEMLNSVWNTVNSFEEFSITKGIKIFIDEEPISVGRKHATFNRKNKTCVMSGDDSIPISNFDVSNMNSNEEFLKTYLQNEGLPVDWSIEDTPILTGYQCDYEFIKKDDAEIEKSVASLCKEYGIDILNEYDVSYKLTPDSNNRDMALDFISLTVYGATDDNKQVTICVTYGIMMCD